MNEIIDMAAQLGKAIAGSKQASDLREARKGLDAEPATLQVLKDYQAQADKMNKLEQENKIIEVEDKRKLQELHDKLIASGAFKKFTAAQMEYVDLLRQVSMAMRTELAETEK